MASYNARTRGHPVDVRTLRDVGRRIREHGWPAPMQAPEDVTPKNRDAKAAPVE